MQEINSTDSDSSLHVKYRDESYNDDTKTTRRKCCMLVQCAET